jgi:hypothetical protein
MKFILEYKNYFQIGDKVMIEYWYNNMVTPVEIIEKVGKRFKVSHNIPESKIQNAPEETIKSKEIICPYREAA